MPDIVLYGFDGSTYVRTIKMLLVEKGVSDYRQVPVNVLEREPHSPEHKQRHPFAKVPVLEFDGFRLIETAAIARYLNDKLPGKSLIPQTLEDRARMDQAVGVLDSYGYGAIAGGVAAYHLYPDLFGGKTEAMRENGLALSRTVLRFLMRERGSAPFLVGELSVADLLLAPMMEYAVMTPDKDALLGLPGVADWWARMEAVPSFQSVRLKNG